MSYRNWLPLALCSIVAISSAHADTAEPLTGPVDLRDDAGQTLIAADQITSYDWSTHTLTLAPGTRTKLAAEFMKGTRLISGIPFAVTVGGKPAYSGKFTSLNSSFSFSTPVIVIDPKSIDPKISDDQLRIQLGYPTPEFFRGEDPRSDERLRAALRFAGKLSKAPPEYTQWIADSLLEIQSIKRGMTRAQLLQVFEEEGGHSTRTERRYAYRDCPYIKVNVKFEPVEALGDKHTNHPTDKIRDVSQPFLEWTISD